MSSIPLQDADIWDDSALIRSWDEALEEYQVIWLVHRTATCLSNISQKYHSIHARGEKVEEVLADYANGTQTMVYVDFLEKK